MKAAPHSIGDEKVDSEKPNEVEKAEGMHYAVQFEGDIMRLSS